MHKRPILMYLAPGILALSMIGCAGGSADINAGGGGLSGVIDTDRFTIPAGETRTVTGDLRIRTTEELTIDGTLRIPAGVTVELFAGGDLTVDGMIEPHGPTASTPDIEGLPDHYTVLGGRSVHLNGNIRVPSDLYVFVNGDASTTSGRDSHRTITVTGEITAPDGRNAVGREDEATRGHDIDLGGSAAFDAAIRGEANPLQVVHITIAGRAIAGNGGNGFNDVNGVAEGKNLNFRGTHGARGGQLRIETDVLFFVSGALYGGNGGSGGSVGPDLDYKKAPDGIAPGEKGGSVTAVAGNGGDAGGLSIKTRFVQNGGSVEQRGGNGGSAGFSSVAPGNGGLGGDGGDMTLTRGVPGKKGSNSTDGRHTMTTISFAGNGGDSTEPSRTGGNGGSLKLSGPEEGLVRVIGSFQGGEGFNGCEVLPVRPGTDGGKGGSTNVEADYSDGSYDGGRGGDGMGPGNGGSEGEVNGAPAGVPGGNGTVCTWFPETVVGDGYVALVVENPFGPFIKGDVIPLVRIRGGHMSNPELNWAFDHLHGFITRVTVVRDGRTEYLGPFEDISPTTSGFGSLTVRTSSEIQSASGLK